MGDINWIACGPDKVGTAPSGVRIVRLDTTSSPPNVHLKLQNISTRLAKDIPPVILDLLEVGAYVYAADQAVARGGKTLRGDGANWRRTFHFNIPVRNPRLWNSAEVKSELRSTLSFLSDDHYEFNFRTASKDPPLEKYFHFDDGVPWFEADEVALFSGGLDSFAGLCQSTLRDNRRVVLVGHRAAPQISKRQVELLNDFRKVTGQRYQILHVPVWVYKGESLTRDSNQRTRSFLFAMLAASIAEMQRLSGITFNENGIVSFNLSELEQVVGGRATRSTHPRALKGMANLLTLALGREFKIRSPLLWKTRAEVMQSVIDMGMAQLIKSTNSCAHVRTGDPINTHCGVCSQCIDRRFSALYCRAGDRDPEEMYKIRLPIDAITGTEDRTMTEAYVRFARGMRQISIDDFFAKYGKAMEILPYLELSTTEAAQRLFDIHKRHGEQVCEAIESQIREHADIIANGSVNSNSLLAMVIGQKTPKPVDEDSTKRFAAVSGLTWEDITIELISLDSVRISVGDVRRDYTGFEMGFRDHRKGNALNQQWDLLVGFAEGGGVINTENPRNKKAINKSVSDLRKTLREFFSLDGEPISNYRKKSGWVTRFRILSRPV